MWYPSLFVVAFFLAVNGLLDEKFVSFEHAEGLLNLAGATILADAEDFVGVHIALMSLAGDFAQITGRRPEVLNVTANATLSVSGSAIIVGSVNSALVRQLSAQGILDVSDVEGRWEVFKTAVVENPMPGLAKALVVVGSDKRGTIFGVHTLAEQSGQSP
jgi:hypothetical protein